jgi:hypothetical protein
MNSKSKFKRRRTYSEIRNKFTKRKSESGALNNEKTWFSYIHIKPITRRAVP